MSVGEGGGRSVLYKGKWYGGLWVNQAGKGLLCERGMRGRVAYIECGFCEVCGEW